MGIDHPEPSLGQLYVPSFAWSRVKPLPVSYHRLVVVIRCICWLSWSIQSPHILQHSRLIGCLCIHCFVSFPFVSFLFIGTILRSYHITTTLSFYQGVCYLGALLGWFHFYRMCDQEQDLLHQLISSYCLYWKCGSAYSLNLSIKTIHLSVDPADWLVASVSLKALDMRVFWWCDYTLCVGALENKTDLVIFSWFIAWPG